MDHRYIDLNMERWNRAIVIDLLICQLSDWLVAKRFLFGSVRESSAFVANCTVTRVGCWFMLILI